PLARGDEHRQHLARHRRDHGSRAHAGRRLAGLLPGLEEVDPTGERDEDAITATGYDGAHGAPVDLERVLLDGRASGRRGAPSGSDPCHPVHPAVDRRDEAAVLGDQADRLLAARVPEADVHRSPTAAPRDATARAAPTAWAPPPRRPPRPAAAPPPWG